MTSQLTYIDGGLNKEILATRRMCREQHAIPLSNGHVQEINSVRLSVDTIDLDNGQVVAGDFEVSTYKVSSVDDVQQVCLTGRDLHRDVLSIVEQTCVRNGLGSAVSSVFGRLIVLDQIRRLSVIPISNGHDQFPTSHFEGRAGIVDDQGTSQAVGNLAVNVTVPPFWFFLNFGRETNGEVICENGAGGDRTLCCHGWPVHLILAYLIEAVKMDTGRLVAKVVRYLQDQTVPLTHIDCRRRPLVVHSDNGPSETVRGDPFPS
ncbi:hypothetical protein RRF57_010628 [Xylaria bambusicola]|uniref:Uncharacterized protein n=1 Tax=Xylaria bambusicola TaxID=326684 RepID=A0AAN7UYF4_9PEZI